MEDGRTKDARGRGRAEKWARPVKKTLTATRGWSVAVMRCIGFALNPSRIEQLFQLELGRNAWARLRGLPGTPVSTLLRPTVQYFCS